MRRQTAPTVKRSAYDPPFSPPSNGGDADLLESRLGKAEGKCAAIRRRLLAWYAKNKRDLPWRRRQSDPYAQWVAEIMLQQTRVETVLRYYEPFLARFPTIQALAQARHQDVLKMWEGLGYYRRALHLHRAAQELCKHNKEIPTSAKDFRQLSGVGDYTAAAIASIAYGEPVAAVDANVARVLGRLLGLAGKGSGNARAELHEAANRLLNKKRPGDFNQAWMDLGSSACLPRTPRCSLCPLKKYCVTANQTEAVTVKASTKPKPAECATAVVMLKHKESFLMRRRPEGGLWSGLWEFPSIDFANEKTAATLARIGAQHSLMIANHSRKVGVVRHQLTHKSISFHVFEASLKERGSVGKSTRWVSHKAFERLPVSTAHRRIYGLWLGSGLNGRPTGA